MADEILFESKDHVAVVTLNRPEARNALNLSALAALADAWTRIDQDPDIRVAILTGAVVSLTGPNVKAVLQNTTRSSGRGISFSIFNLTDDLGKVFPVSSRPLPSPLLYPRPVALEH